MPAVIGAKPGIPRCGLTHTTRCASRASRAICAPSRVASPRSQPSEAITTTAPRATPRWPQRSRNALTSSPSRVPPLQSGTAPDTASRAADGSRLRISRVTRVSRVPTVNTSVPVRRRAAACANRRYGSA